jgi:hypothetical protein
MVDAQARAFSLVFMVFPALVRRSAMCRLELIEIPAAITLVLPAHLG